ncbi:MAG: hypothetical protein IKG66_04875 [Lachnospiraceae bacterium]|nr:hypothetical protein [Lachnospiraceae bacterium]
MDDFKTLIRSAHPYLDCFDYDHYPSCFQTFASDLVPVLEACRAGTGSGADPVETVLDALAKEYKDLPRKERIEISSRDKRVLALFLTPAALQAGGEAEDFARRLCEGWKARFPRDPYYIGTYETILKGFDANLLGLPLRKSRMR